MGNKVKYNLKNVHAAKLTETTEDGVTKYTYEAPQAIPGAVSISLDAEGDSSPFYADGIVYFRSNTNNGYSGDLEIALIPEWFRTDILQEKLDSNGVLVEKSDNAGSVKFALLFEFDGDVRAIRHVMYNCTASRPSIESETKEDKIEPGTETLSLTADPREDGLVKSRTGDTTSAETYANWYKSVYIPQEEEAKGYVFKYDKDSVLVGATQATLTAQVQGVTISKWQYKDNSGSWVDYPTTADNTNITSGILVVKPSHAVFINNVAQIKVVTSDTDVFDTVTITKIFDGVKGDQGDKGDPGSSGSGGLSVILGNEAQVIACTSEGKTATASTISIPFTGYVGITQTACACSVGTLPTGITVKSNAAATASTAGILELSVAASSDLGGTAVLTGNITLTFTISGKSVVKTFTWTKAKAGSNGTNAVVFSVYAPNGTVVQNQSGTLTLATSAYSGTTAITSATYQWAKYANGTWTNISGATSSTLTVSGADIVNIQSYRCTMTYSGKTYVDVITVEDKSDPYVSEMLSIGGFTVKNNLGGVVPYVIVRTNQKEVDELLGVISEAEPSTPKSGDYWYKIDHSGKTVTLMKYSGTAWASTTDTQSLTYTWYAQDKDGKEMTFGKTGKVIYLSAADIDSIMTLQCDVSN